MKMFCITIYDDHYEKIKKLGYVPVGLGKDIISNEFKKDNMGDNISKKNLFYGEYTFHYWIWKNEIDKLKNDWIGFCQYRKFWSHVGQQNQYLNIDDLKKNLINEIPKNYSKFESILGEPVFINQFKPSKFLKKNLFKFLKQPDLFFNKNKRNIRFHFNLMHGDGNLDKAVELIDKTDRNDFKHFINTQFSFNPHNMFICRSNTILQNYYDSLFPWLERCEKIFGFNLQGYGLKRIYGFLAERFMSFWFKKYTKSSTLPIIFKDISELD